MQKEPQNHGFFVQSSLHIWLLNEREFTTEILPEPFIRSTGSRHPLCISTTLYRYPLFTSDYYIIIVKEIVLSMLHFTLKFSYT